MPDPLDPVEALRRIGEMSARHHRPPLGFHLHGRADMSLPSSINVRHPEPGFLYSPDQGEHAGHVIEFVSANGLRFNILGQPLRSWLVRCRACHESWAFPPEDGGDGGELFIPPDPPASTGGPGWIEGGDRG